MHSITSKLHFRTNENSLPPHNDVSLLAEGFSNFFMEKIDNIKIYLKSLNGDSLIGPLHYDQRTTLPPTFSKFKFLSETDTKKLMKSPPTTLCELDPKPTTLFKEHNDTLAPIITTIVKYLQHSEF